MVYYLKGLMEDLPQVIMVRSMIPAANHLFQFRPEYERKILDKDQATAFHHILVQLLFVTLRASKDINMSVTFLCNQVRSLDEDNCVNLSQVHQRYPTSAAHTGGRQP